MLEELESRITQSSFIKSIIEKDNEKLIGKVEDNEFHNSMALLQSLDNQLTILKSLKHMINPSVSVQDIKQEEKETSTIDPVVGDIVLSKSSGKEEPYKVLKMTDFPNNIYIMYGYKNTFDVINLSGNRCGFIYLPKKTHEFIRGMNWAINTC